MLQKNVDIFFRAYCSFVLACRQAKHEINEEKKCEMHGNSRASIDDCFVFFLKKKHFVEFEEYEII